MFPASSNNTPTLSPQYIELPSPPVSNGVVLPCNSPPPGPPSRFSPESVPQSPSTSSSSGHIPGISSPPVFTPICDIHIDLPIPPNPINAHPMLTRSKTWTIIPRAHITHISNDLEPLSVKHALTDPKWQKAMQDEFIALQRLGTWSLVPFQPDMKIVSNKWIFRVKRLPDGSVDRYKARLVAKGF